ncbi:MAG TPA: type III pantothenate kinase [Fimbriimonas sp.]|nr:type III pantothenate kinase [Fimbriimonas sp.]
MLLAIDVGNTHSVFGLWDGLEWIAVWRHTTDPDMTEDELAAWLRPLFEINGLEWKLEDAVCASVAPAVNETLDRLCERWFGLKLKFVRGGQSIGLEVDYHPVASVGADRLANALGALQKYEPPLIVVDFGTGTNFDVVDAESRYVGGAIMPGVLVGSEALFRKAAKLPHVDRLSLVAPQSAIGKSTVESLQSGIVLGYAAAIDGLVRRIRTELGGDCRVIATGGLGAMFHGLCETIEAFEATMTLDGLRVAAARLV